MSKRLIRLGFDIDGVLANFTKGYLGLVNRDCGTNYQVSDWTDYGHPSHPKFIKEEHWKAGWSAVKREPYFWSNLHPLTSLTGLINKAMAGCEFHGYFFTKRMDLDTTEPGDATLLTRLWLAKNHITEYAGLVVTTKQNRVDMLRACEIDAYIDDWGDQFLEVEAAGFDAYLIDRIYNREINTDKRVTSLGEFMARATGNQRLDVNPEKYANPAVVAL